MKKHILNVLQIAKDNGCKCYFYEKDNNTYFTWGYIVFPDNVIMSVNKNYYDGLDFAIEYVPSRETGSCCSCKINRTIHDDITGVSSQITWDKLQELKKEGLLFARKLKATLYPSAKEWERNCYCFNQLQEV